LEFLPASLSPESAAVWRRATVSQRFAAGQVGSWTEAALPWRRIGASSVLARETEP